MGRKIATIGITINLENYENLRLEVQGEVGEDGDTGELVAFLDGMLGRLGHGDQATAERVEAYRRRVLAAPGSAVIAAAPDWQVPASATPPSRPAAAAPAPEPAIRAREPALAPVDSRSEAPPEAGEAPPSPATVRVTPETRVVKPAPKPQPQPKGEAKPPAAPAPAPEPRKALVPQPPKEAPAEAKPKPEKPVIAEGEVACEGCGVSITKNQEKLSRLLTGKSLCKRCMNP